MPYSTAAKNLMLNALAGTNPTTPITHCGLQTKGANITGVTSTGSPDTFTKTAHGLANGDVIIFTAVTGGTGLKAGSASNADGKGYPYFVINTAANTFQIAETVRRLGRRPVLGRHAATVNKLTEISGGSPAYARKAIAFAAAAAGLLDDSTNGAVVDVPAAAVVDFVSFHSAVSAGTLLGIDSVTQETFAAQGTYTVTDAKLDLVLADG
jgi:hypothetical protein